MNQGPSTDIITGLPLEYKSRPGGEPTPEEESRLRDQAGFLGISTREDGLRLIAVIEAKLFSRIEAMIQTDPQARAYLDLLATLGIKENMARKATARLVEAKTGVNLREHPLP